MRKVLCVVLCLGYAVGGYAWTVAPESLVEYTTRAARIFRGYCVSAEVGEAEVAGAHLPITTYTFQVRESLKGVTADTVTFRQVGSPNGGRSDLGRLVGLPVYVPGMEYVLFLLPEHSRTALTSPAGAAQAAFVISGEQVRGVHGGHALLSPGESTAQGDIIPGSSPHLDIPYATLRHTVLHLLGR